jgi:hypothetical protein
MDQWISKAGELEGKNYLLEQELFLLKQENKNLKIEISKLYEILVQFGFAIDAEQ